jgi:hypothetical protein
MELMIALAISGLIVLTARALVVAVLSVSERLDLASVKADRVANGERLLRTLVARLDVSQPGSRFEGTDTRIAFPTWCDASAGWLEPCNAAVMLRAARDSAVLAVSLSGQPQMSLLSGRTIALRYLGSAASGGTWFERWGMGVSVPLGVAVIVDGDTLLVRVGARGTS